MHAEKTPDHVSNVLDRIDQHSRRVRLAVLGAAAVEGLLLILCLALIDWDNELHILLFLLSILTYSVIALGMMALGAHVSRVGLRVVAALERNG